MCAEVCNCFCLCVYVGVWCCVGSLFLFFLHLSISVGGSIRLCYVHSLSIAFLCVKERKCAKLPNDLDSRSARRKGVTHINPSIFGLRLFHARFTPRCAPRRKTHFPTALRGSPWAATSSPPASSCKHQGLENNTQRYWEKNDKYSPQGNVICGPSWSAFQRPFYSWRQLPCAGKGAPTCVHARARACVCVEETGAEEVVNYSTVLSGLVRWRKMFKSYIRKTIFLSS